MRSNSLRLFRDFLFTVVLFLVALFVLTLPLVNQPTKSESESHALPGSVVANIAWPAGHTDVDMWVIGPGDESAVGYSRLRGQTWSLLRDDVGDRDDLGPANFENAYARGIRPGEYVVKVHCYRCPVVPQMVAVEIFVIRADGVKNTLFKGVVVLTEDHQELTAASFFLDGDGNIRPGTLSTLYRPLRVSLGE